MTQPGSYAHLGELIKTRRQKLGLSPSKVQSLGGPSVVTLRKMEAGDPTRRRLDTTYPLEQILGWSSGSINGYLDYGTTPHVVRDPIPDPLVDLTAVPLDQLEAEIRRRREEQQAR